MPDTTAKKRRLVFLTVNSSFSHSSLALPLLHSACRELDNWEWVRYDMTIAQDIMGAVSDINALDGDLLVTTLYLFNRETALNVLQRCHALAPECRIAVGGPECLGGGAGELQRRYPWLDRIFRGEGEALFRNYLDSFDAPAPPSPIVPPDSNGEYAEWSDSDFPVNDPFFVTDKPFAQMETSRGCPIGCFYCTSGGTHPRYRSISHVREELSLLRARGVKELRLLDRTFNLPQERGAALLRLFREEFPQMRFHLELHPQFLNEAVKDELRQALPGQLHIETGIQCLDQEVQRLSGRRSAVPAVLEGMKFLCSLSAFETHADLLAGLPGQKWSHILEDTATLMTLGVAEIQLEVLKILPGTPMVNIAPCHGIRYSASTPYDVMRTDTMSLEEIRLSRDLSRLLDMSYNNTYLHGVVSEMNKACPEFVPQLLRYFHKAGGNAAAIWDLQKRFVFLHGFCMEHDLHECARLLAFQWLMAGFPPEQGADRYSVKSVPPPADARLQTGSEACLNARETRFRTLETEEKLCYFAFNRSFALNRPAAVWEKEK